MQVFDQHWHKLFQFGHWGDGNGEFSRPESMVIDAGLVYITDACNHRIDVFTTEGKWVRNMGSTGSGLGQFRFPYGLAEDKEGHLIVCEFGNNRVQMIDKQTGRGLKIWGGPGREPGEFAYPMPSRWTRTIASSRWMRGTIGCRCLRSEDDDAHRRPARLHLAHPPGIFSGLGGIACCSSAWAR